jgi:RNA polymerase sigma-70 factor (ECF subfamily)
VIIIGGVALDDISAQWLASLTATGSTRDDAHARLHGLMLRIARSETRRRSGSLRVSGAELDDLAHQAAADAMLSVLGKLDTFRGESRFTTWAYKFVMFEVSNKIARHFWQTMPERVDHPDWDDLPARIGFGPEQGAEWRDLLEALRHVVENELSERQRRIFIALVLEGTPLDVLALEVGSNRNAIYKTMFDARVKLRASLTAKGFLK